MTKRKIVIITGVLGQDGQILSNILIKKKYNIIGIVKKIPKARKNKIRFNRKYMGSNADPSKGPPTYIVDTSQTPPIDPCPPSNP